MRLLVCTLTLPILLASASRAEVILVHNHCGSLHFHFFSDGHRHHWHHEHELDHESVPCLCETNAPGTSDRAANEENPRGLIIHVHELPHPGTTTPTLTSANPDRIELFPVSICSMPESAHTALDGRPPSRARDHTHPQHSRRVRAILLANHALLL